MILLAASLFFVDPSPVEMPEAEAYLVKEEGRLRLEDRYDPWELWTSRAVVGRWLDGDFRQFTFCRFVNLPPATAKEERRTRSGYEEVIVEPNRRDESHLRRFVDALSPVEPAAKPERIRQCPNALGEVLYFEGTNVSAVVCAFREREEHRWYLAIWELAEGDDHEERRKTFEEEFFDQGEWRTAVAMAGAESDAKDVRGKSRARRRKIPDERELLRRDARHSVEAYARWHFTSSEEFAILDDLDAGRDFVIAVTNELPALRRRFAETIPTPIDTTNTLCVARIFRNRDDFLIAAGESMQWSAAFWNQRRRELVASMPEDGSTAELKKTFRHESFHQYLSYASSMIAVSPWLNEGYAQYFEDEDECRLGFTPDAEKWDELELALPGLLMLDYDGFYDGTDNERRVKYRLAWSIAYFLEHGARKVRFDPFKDLKRDYFAELMKSHDLRRATAAAFGSEEKIELFANEWKKFWKARAD